jgi:hypothetical protein
LISESSATLRRIAWALGKAHDQNNQCHIYKTSGLYGQRENL